MRKDRPAGQRAFERAAVRIRELIDAGEMRPGGKLPPERRLAEEFGLSRSSVREAIRLLSEQGVLEARRGSGTYISSPDVSGLEVRMAEAMSKQRERLWHIFEFRRMLEPRLARAAAELADAELVSKLEHFVASQEQALADGKSGSDEDLAFHRAVAEATGNPVAMEALEALGSFIAESRSEVLLTPDRSQNSPDSHRKVLDAIRLGDGDAAEQEMERHLREVEETVFGDDTCAFFAKQRETS